MPGNNSTRHKSSVALILMDIINHFELPDGDMILKNALPMAGRLAKLKQRCWRAGRPFVEALRPDDEVLLHDLAATSLIPTGLATNRWIVCTAHDAKMRHFSPYVLAASSSLRMSELGGESRRGQSKA